MNENNVNIQKLKRLKEPDEIISFFKEEKNVAVIYDTKNNIIYTNKPGVFIGKEGENIKTFGKKLNNPVIKSFKDLGFRQTNFYKLQERIEKGYQTAWLCFDNGNPKGEVYIIPKKSINWLLKLYNQGKIWGLYRD